MAQATAIEKGFAGPKDSKGRQVYPGFMFDTGIASTQGIPGLLHGGLNPVGPPFSATTMDVDARAAAAAASAGDMLSATSSWTNLNTFSNHGGKLMFFHGVSDPWFSALDTIDYYERMTKANGGPESGDELEPAVSRARHRSLRWRTRSRSTRSTCCPRSWTGSRRAPRPRRSRRLAVRCRGAAVRSARIRSTRTTKAAVIRRTRRTSSVATENHPPARS